MRLGLYLRTSRGAAVLAAAIESGVRIEFVVTATDPGMPDDGTDLIIELCDEAGVVCYRDGHAPVRDDSTHTIAAGWRSMLDTPNLIVMHDSLLPRYRGWSPLIAALIEGEGFVGVTAILAEQDGFDTGPIVGQERAEVVYPQTIARTIESVVPAYRILTQRILRNRGVDWPTEGVAQDERDATYTIWRDHDDYRIDWTQDVARIRRHVDACGHPHPGAWTTIPKAYGEQRLLVLAAEEVEDVRFEERHPGKVLRLDGIRPVVVCGSGLLRIDALEWPPPITTHHTDAFRSPLLPLSSVRTRFA